MSTNPNDNERYYCIPPFHGVGDQEAQRSGLFYLVSQGRVVGIFDDWLAAQASVSGFPNNSHRKYSSIKECNEAWRSLCRWGMHDHPVDPTSPYVCTSPQTPRKATTDGSMPVCTSPVKPHPNTPVVKKEEGLDLDGLHTPSASRMRLPPSRINFAIRGAGIISSSTERTRERYLEMQRRGEEPDLLLMCSLGAASQFALDEEDPEAL
ncbi:hypothetical protein K438DRAFT_1959509 [Mycena galopus ATCC 62051]|nr:hypothetical protein K438DRAFT_1959509 [Mycena galopus ATCC 62051]